MASVIVVENKPTYRSSYPNKHTPLGELKRQPTVLITALVVRTEKSNELLKEENVERNPFNIVELKDGTGTGLLFLRNTGILDTAKETLAKQNTLKFFEDAQGKVVHILNATVKQSKKKDTIIQIDQWSQLRLVHDEEIIKTIHDSINNPKQHQDNVASSKDNQGNTEKSQKKTNTNNAQKKAKAEKVPKVREEKPIEFQDVFSLTPNDRSANFKVKVVDVVEFKRMKGFLPDASKQLDENGQEIIPENDSIKVTFADRSGRVYGVFPNQPKFEMLKKGAIVSLLRAKIDRFEGDVKGDSQIFVTVFLKDEKHPKYKGVIELLNPEEEKELNDLSFVPGEGKDKGNVSNKIWVAQTPE